LLIFAPLEPAFIPHEMPTTANKGNQKSKITDFHGRRRLIWTFAAGGRSCFQSAVLIVGIPDYLDAEGFWLKVA